MTERKKPELLAPAGNPLALRAAVENGADAVYLGGKMFGARAFAENFTEEDLASALSYAHGRGVRIYVTVNTLVDNREFGELTDYLFFLYREGVDALIVQDVGVAGYIRAVLPDFRLHGSTQMTVHNAAGARFLAEAGFQRVILARETTYSDLQEIRKHSSLELEVFVHGALCICYSGQCLFSSMIGGRSGNRGRCAQPCRLPYSLVDEKGRELSDSVPGEHLLSPRDLLLLRELPDLCRVGVAALKIEGRMKRPEYVATVVRIYREALDRAWEDPEHYTASDREVRELSQIFNRGFTTGYFYGNPGRGLIGYTRPNNRGLYLGRVVKKGHRHAVLQNRLPLRTGDGIEFWTGSGRHGLTVQGMTVKDREVEEAPPGSDVQITVPFHVSPGDRVFKTHDRVLIEKARESFTGPSRRRTPITLRAVARIGEPFYLVGWDADGCRAESRGNICGEKARKHELTPEILRAQLDRLGNTPFQLKKLECELEPGVMLPLSEINAVRRSLTAALEEKHLQKYRRRLPQDLTKREEGYWSGLQARARDVQKVIRRPSLAVAVSDLPSLQAAAAGGADIIYFGGYSLKGRAPWTDEALRRGIEDCLGRGVQPYLIIPRIWQEREGDRVLRMLEEALLLSVAGVLVGDLGGCYLALKKDLSVVTDFSVPVFNDSAIFSLLEAGVSRATLSPELNREQLMRLTYRGSEVLELPVHGAIPLMISEHCVTGAVTGEGGRCMRICSQNRCYLKDRCGYLFPVVQDERCRMTIYNARELCLIEHLAEIIEEGYDHLRLELRYSQAREVKEITSIYRSAVDAVVSGCWSRERARHAWEKLSVISPLGLTRGHYLRGVLRAEERKEGALNG
ncbi:peptidase U32 [Thermacetogenium phaeum DSM 12270]|jgi:putative protease|uniref:Peptidase U32 n=2 Tax=Thermacetogenium phaeum TaxID=85874 RepID=K4LU53_THEPS|nr:peptidase U32 [Thermacetogenium phaeum DSM 12270]